MNDKVENKAVTDALEAVRAISAPLKAALEQIISETDVGSTIACYDEGTDADFGEKVCTEAAEYVLRGMIGAMAYNVVEGRAAHGQQQLNAALDKIDAAAVRDESFRTEKSGDQLSNAIFWGAKMDVQQVYRAALQDFAKKFYATIAGERYPTKIARSTKPRETAAQNTALSIRERRAQANA